MRKRSLSHVERVESLATRSQDVLRYRKVVGAVSAVALLASAGCSGNRVATEEQPAKPDNYTVETDGVRLHVEALGSGDAKEVAIAIHGGPGLSLTSLDELEPLAGEDRRLVRYDQRGAGKSSAPKDGDYSFDSQVADIEAVRQSTGVEKVDVIGRSWGGLLATAYAVSHPEHVDDLVLISSVPLDINEYLAGQERFSERMAQLQQAGEVPSPLPEIENNSCTERSDAVLPAYMAHPDDARPESVGSCTADSSQQAYEALFEPGLLQPYAIQAQRYTGDVLVLAGDKDPFGLEWPQRIEEILGRGAVTRVIFEDTGHFVTFERPDESLQLIDKALG